MFAGIDLSEVEQLIDERREPFAVLVDDPQVLAHLAGSIPRSDDLFERGADEAQRGPYFMCDGDEEFNLRLKRFFLRFSRDAFQFGGPFASEPL